MVAQSSNVGVSRPWKRAPRSLHVVRDPRPEDLAVEVDWSAWYLTDEEDMGEGNEQAEIIDTLRSSLRVLGRERGWRVHVGGNQFFAWVPSEPLVRVSPDVYVLDDPPEPPLPPSWQTWRAGHRPPRFAVEIVSGDDRHPERWRKDYDSAPDKYAQLGAGELCIFDPEAAAGRARDAERVALQLYRRTQDGGFIRVHNGDGPVRTRELGAALVVVRVGAVARLRVARDDAGQDIVSTEAEVAEAERQRAETERQRAELAERELVALRAEVERLRGG